MNTAIIAEYNPFHNGHMLHINKTKEKLNTNIIAVMSGNFVQRGEPAMLNKHIRTKFALMNGVDMVLELPVEYATSSADVFAFGGCDIIKKSNIINCISFGCENGNTEDFLNIARLLKNETADFKSELNKGLSKGLSFPKAREEAIKAILDTDTSFLNNSNNILALEYIKNILDTDIMPFTIKREVSSYNGRELTGEISSATAIREAIFNGNKEALSSVPENIKETLKKSQKITLDDYSSILHYVIRTKREKIANAADVTEGLENRIIAMSKGQSITDFIEDIKSKRYTYTKIKRALLHIILDIKKSDQSKNISYIRVLGVRRDKLHLLSELCSKSDVPVITKVKGNEDFLAKEIMTTDIYNINGETGLEYRQPMVVL